jgi:hypothetical protein
MGKSFWVREHQVNYLRNSLDIQVVCELDRITELLLREKEWDVVFYND